MLVPHKGKQVVKVHLPIKTLTYALIAFFFFTAILTGLTVNHLNNIRIDVAEKTELITLRNENARIQQVQQEQDAQIEELAKDIASLQEKSDELSKLDHEVRTYLNNPGSNEVSRSAPIRITPSASQYTGQGGAIQKLNINNIKALAQNLNIELTHREENLTEVKTTLEARQARLDATPSLWPTEGQVTSRYGWRRGPFGGGSDFHPGIDIANSTGTPIIATAAGVVTYSGYMSGYGYLIAIDHGYGIETYYGHNSRNYVEKGETVQKGEVIAAMGSTGYSTGPHVHYEVRVNGTHVDPGKFL